MEDLMFNEYKNSFTSSSIEVSEKEIIEKIRTGYRIKGKIGKLRKELQKNGKTFYYKNWKSHLPAFIIGGKYSNSGRKSEHLQIYNGWMVLDIDGIKSEEEYQELFNKTIKNPFVRAVFRSPSGNGMKIIVVTDNKDSEKHTELYKKLLKYYESILNVKFDETTCEVNRLCFYSYDPNIYHNESSEILEFGTLGENFSNEESHEKIFETKFLNEIQFAIDFTNKVTKFHNRNRNNYIYLLGKNCCGYGMDKQTVIDYCIIHFSDEDFDGNEIELAIENGYLEKKDIFGKYGYRFDHIKKSEKIEQKRISSEISIFEKFSSKLDSTFSQKYKNVLNQLKTERDKEMYILGMITTLESIYKTE
ncbi:BT4734/BF3469 family protein [Cloacibacterium sp.]|uniref:BT4734/BF3469 family protein n=1 Tax=Cloacibacterium sp. TaxID=1913682 RepID=UPI0039E626C5